ncbi:glycosyltransferase family 9 protein [Polynucleobacter paneuropaeus]|nr:glycosyltransferase family 9 protein [Polynucleobacter paneuropaeus]MBT8543582.1 glycosyltransferase family 9 protein [Polynucleobacter paneuropaeus]MBT8564520.1 glycosyltransferase family 9 protein [Polynucleobacter paneuropaeus]MBT8574814.1 glycosyltransferase family 9 protein [Polynucleobacter paneuropaeus]MBT8579639.1 glycosyltransferase family 9 protein [Polynucleobacter paneuropaeus]
MSVNTMRAIDHWVGVPLCALVSPLVALVDRIKSLFTPTLEAPKKLLFIELSEMGSAILVDPAMRNAQARGAELFFLIFKSNRASLSLLNTVKPENIFTIDSSSLGGLIKDTLRFLWIARCHKIDTVIDLELFSRFTALLTGLCGAQRRVGYHIFHGEGLWRGTMLTRKVHYNPHIHITKNFLSLIHAAYAKEIEVPFSKIQILDSEVRLEQAIIDTQVKNAVLERIVKLASSAGIPFAHGRQRLILINPNASDLLPQRRWAQARFSELIQSIAKRYPDDLILITGSPAEIAYVETVRSVANVAHALNFAGQVSFSELPALYTLSDVMVTNDSGPGHFSAVTPLRTIVLFGPETPALYGSLGNSISITANLACSPCVSAANHRKTPCHNNVCMQAISVKQVMEKVELQLQAADLAKQA